MRRSCLWMLLLCAAWAPAHAQAASPAERAGIEVFNRALTEATRHMDNAASLALWEDDGVSLLPATKPMVGKPVITKFLHDVMSSHKGARMETFEMHCFGIEVSGDWASEYCDEHQVVRLASGKPPFDGRGQMLFVLHRGGDNRWRLRREMWTEGVPPAPR